ncbi:MAG: TIGR04255 family protein [Defluviicoccus sp.]|nr:TIGR04255 family protein [Defluviicoccus sp.]MDG4608695.1 TIGR04255 family protein [Defluviicoccus sp.]
MQNLPKILEREPLVDAVFEVRLGGGTLLADILPGFLFHELDPRPKLSRLPAAEIPQPLRANDPALQFVPVMRVEWDHYFIAIGDQNIVISCKLPYPKWPNFKAAILDIMGRIAKVGIPGQVERYSVKYVNLIHAQTLSEQIAKIKMAIELGSLKVREDQVSLQVHRKEDDMLHILSVIIGAEGKLPDGRRVLGAVVDIDSIRTVNVPNFTTFVSNLGPAVEELRQANKAKFFSCLTDETIEEMGPIYE